MVRNRFPLRRSLLEGVQNRIRRALKPAFHVALTGGAIRLIRGSGAMTFVRSSNAVETNRQIPRESLINEPRLDGGKGALIEGSDESKISVNVFVDQNEIDAYWNGHETDLLRAFDFENDWPTNGQYRYDDAGKSVLQVTNVEYVDGKAEYGRAVSFPLPTSVITIGCPTDLDNRNTFTVSAWVYSTSATRQIILLKTMKYFELIQSGAVCVLHGAVQCATSWAGSTSSTTMSLNAWHHVAMTYDSTSKTIKLYLDGAEVAYSSQVAGVGAETSEAGYYAQIGAWGDGSHYVLQGYLDSFRWYDRKLDGAEIAAIFTDGDLIAFSCAAYNTASSTMVSFTYDDDNTSDYSVVFPLFQSKGVKGTCFIISSHIVEGSDEHLHYLEMQEAGWEIASHTKTHPNLTTLGSDDLVEELDGSKYDLETLGFVIRTIAYPGGAQNSMVRQYAARDYEAARIVTHYGHIPKTNSYALPGYEADDDSLLDTYKGYIDQAAANGLWTIFFQHMVTAADAVMLDALIDYIQARGIPIVTMAEGYDRCTHGLAFWERYGKLCAAGHDKAFYYTVALSNANYIVAFYARKSDGSEITNADIEAFADTALVNEIALTKFEQQNNGVYLCWGEFSASSDPWNIGVEVKAGKFIEVCLITCYEAAPSNQGGSFVRSLIDGGSEFVIADRGADNLTIPGSGNIGGEEGTIEINARIPCSESEAATYLTLFSYYLNSQNLIRIRIDSGADKLQFGLYMGGATLVSAEASVGMSRGDHLKIRLRYRQATPIDGTNYVIMEYDLNNAGWIQACASATQPDGTMLLNGTIYIGSYVNQTYHWGSYIEEVRIFDRLTI
jgi:peptidoglycan/xylan/chitin deacetylase (PgdA/CDA1 family)